jgi:hypothetical protein
MFSRAHLLRSALFAFFGILILPLKAAAWGPGVHVSEGSYILNNLHLILPWLAELLRSFPNDYLYGCVSADILIGKGERRRDDHCHNWSVGKKMLKSARSRSQKAFAYGYLSHLASDVVAHNFYVPNQLYTTSTTRKLGHLYWEYRSDAHIEKRLWPVVKKVMMEANDHHDRLIQRVVQRGVIPFKTKKRIYSGTIKLRELDQWHQTVLFVSKNSRWAVPDRYLAGLRKDSLALVVDFLSNPDEAVCLGFDPVGTDNLKLAKRKRRISRRINGEKPRKGIFEIPEEIVKLSR